MVTNLDCGELLAILSYTTDARKAPDKIRRSRFHGGWSDATNYQKTYEPKTLKKLTWTNLGYRLGKQFGTRSEIEIDSLFDRFAEYYCETHDRY